MLVRDTPEPPESSAGADGGDRSPRLAAGQIGASSRARLLPGGEVEIVNLSASGMLVEGQARPRVGVTVSIKIAGLRIRKLEGHIVRSRVSTIHRDGTLTYETAIEFVPPDALASVLDAHAEGASGGGEPGPDVYVLGTDNDW